MTGFWSHQRQCLLLFCASLGALFLASAVIFALVLFFGQRHILFETNLYDDAADPRQIGMTGTQVVFLPTGDGLSLASWYKPAYPGCPTLLFFHGNEGDVKQAALNLEQLLHAGFGALMLEYRGYGGNPGKPSEQGLFEDGRAAVRFLRQKGLPPEQLVFVAHSLGTGVAVKMAEETPPKQLVLLAPYTSIGDVAGHSFNVRAVGYLARDRFASIDRIGKVHVPLLLIHGEADDIIPAFFGHKLLNAANSPKQGFFPKAAGHEDLFAQGATDAIIGFTDPDRHCAQPAQAEPR